jgi:hypothetical protein
MSASSSVDSGKTPISLAGRLLSGLGRFARASAGSIGASFGLMLPVLAGGIGVAIDMSSFYSAKSRAQSAADASALATVRELSLIGSDTLRLKSVAERNAMANLGALAQVATVSPSVDMARAELTVGIHVKPQGVFGGLLGIEVGSITVSATARLVGAQKICLIALSPGGNKALSIMHKARINAADCSVFSNSTHRVGLSAIDNSSMVARSICSSGGVQGKGSSFVPAAKTDCPPVPDPLVNRQAPPFGGCDYNNHVVNAGTMFLRPGVYCGGLRIAGNAIAKLDPGIYVIKDGKLHIDNTATFEGVNVGFYLAGNKTTLDFEPGTTISLTAPRDGAMAGLLFFEERGTSALRVHRIASNNAHTLLGTIYLPKGVFFVEANAPVSQRAAFTIIVANQLSFEAGPEFFINANYGATDVPVPGGLGPVSGVARLER